LNPFIDLLKNYSRFLANLQDYKNADFPYQLGFILTGAPENPDSAEALFQPKSAVAISTFYFLLENYSKDLALDFLIAVSTITLRS
jgi:hypothetical protein